MSRKARLLIYVALLAVIALGVLFVATGGASSLVPRGEPTIVEVAALDRGSGYVEVLGTLHYPVRVKQTFEATWLKPEPPTQHIFPLFPQGDTMGRDIRILVISEVEPDRMLGLEDRRVRGQIVRPTSRLLTRGVLDTFREHAYEFDAEFLLLVEDPPPTSER